MKYIAKIVWQQIDTGLLKLQRAGIDKVSDKEVNVKKTKINRQNQFAMTMKQTQTFNKESDARDFLELISPQFAGIPLGVLENF